MGCVTAARPAAFLAAALKEKETRKAITKYKKPNNEANKPERDEREEVTLS